MIYTGGLLGLVDDGVSLYYSTMEGKIAINDFGRKIYFGHKGDKSYTYTKTHLRIIYTEGTQGSR